MTKHKKLLDYKFPSIDCQAPVMEILDILNKYGITLRFIDKVFELVKEDAEKNTVVYTPNALLKLAEEQKELKFLEEERFEAKRLKKLNVLAVEICKMLAEEKVPVSQIQALFHIVWTKAHLYSLPAASLKTVRVKK
jgi:hypothetical protein